MGAGKLLKRVVIPSSIVLTPRILMSAMLKFSAADIEAVAHALIEELDRRCGEPDFEMEPNEDGEWAA